MKKTPPPKNPNDRRNLSGVQFRYFPPEDKYSYHELHAISPDAYNKNSRTGKGLVVGRLQWHPKSGEVNWVRTHENYRGLGVASTLWEKANKLSADTGIRAPKHSRHRTDQGDAWAKSVGGVTPSRANYEEW
jgi:GNAT superfamily N-acetyltransferase